jgi:phosphonate transport system ATP-binding protein
MNDRPDVLIEQLRCTAGGRNTLDLPLLRIQPGERVAIIGPNGAGKSTLLQCLAGFRTPAVGRLTVLGQVLAGQARRADLACLRRDVGQVMQGVHLVQRLSVLENVLIGALGRLAGAAVWRSCLRWYSVTETTAAHQALAAVGLTHRADERADRLSGGERQKVAIARLLMQRPRMILADEPTASLDPAAAADVCGLLLRAAAGLTLVSVVHNPQLLPLLAERVIGLRHGRCVFDLPLAAVDAATLAALYHPGVASAVLAASAMHATPACIASTSCAI